MSEDSVGKYVCLRNKITYSLPCISNRMLNTSDQRRVLPLLAFYLIVA